MTIYHYLLTQWVLYQSFNKDLFKQTLVCRVSLWMPLCDDFPKLEKKEKMSLFRAQSDKLEGSADDIVVSWVTNPIAQLCVAFIGVIVLCSFTEM